MLKLRGLPAMGRPLFFYALSDTVTLLAGAPAKDNRSLRAVFVTVLAHDVFVFAVCEMTVQGLHGAVAVCEMIMQHLHGLFTVCGVTMQHLHSVVAVCETTMQHLAAFLQCAA